MADVNPPNGSGIVSGGRDMTLAKATMSAANATVFAFFIFSQPRLISVIIYRNRNTEYSYKLFAIYI
jgi:hypothetical protein